MLCKIFRCLWNLKIISSTLKSSSIQCIYSVSDGVDNGTDITGTLQSSSIQ